MNTKPLSTANSEQADFWGGEAGGKWARLRSSMDYCLAPVLQQVLHCASLAPGQSVLDIGCGAGTSTLQAAQQVGAQGQALGVDISDTLLTAARGQLAQQKQINASFQLCDAQTHVFESAQFDKLISRFGVMFFADAVEAFGNMGRAMKPGGQLSIGTWADVSGNPFFTKPAEVAETLMGPMPASDADGPNPFAMSDIDATCAVLTSAGWQDAKGTEIGLHLTLKGSAMDYADMAMDIGAANRALLHHQPDAKTQKQLHNDLIKLAESWQMDGIMKVPARINVFTARWPG